MAILYRLVQEGKTEDGRRFERYSADLALRAAPVSKWIEELTSDDSSGVVPFLTILRSCKFKAFFFESKPICLEDAFEFVLIEASELGDKHADSTQFKKHFDKKNSRVIFVNQNDDATLVVPLPPEDEVVPLPPEDEVGAKCYSHVAAFCKYGKRDVVAKTWKAAVGKLGMSLKATNDKVYFSTGKGVAWVHFRVETHPKQYCFTQYKE